MKQPHAIVMGASMAGLLAARVLSDHFERVTVLERDVLPQNAEHRKGVPQDQHIHALLAGGFTVMARLFPNFRDELVARGGMAGDVRERLDFYFGGYWPYPVSNLTGAYVSRLGLESLIRDLVRQIKNVTIVSDVDIEGLTSSEDRTRVTGVNIHHRANKTRETLFGDLLVDATGRGSKLPQWLEALGYAPPPESRVNMDLTYTTRIYERNTADDRARGILMIPEPPHIPRAGILFPIENGRYILTLIGLFGNKPPLDEQGFLEFARSLPTPEIYNFIKTAEPLNELKQHHMPYSRWRHYEQLKRMPEGLLAVGDAVSSFNPAYGQGMTVAALEAQVLERWLARGNDDTRPFFKELARVVDMAWSVSVGSDFAFPQTTGDKPPGTDLINGYMRRFVEKAIHDPELTLAFFKVNQLIAPPPTLFHPALMARVFMNRPPKAMPSFSAMARGELA